MRVFEHRWPSKVNEPKRGEVDLTRWPGEEASSEEKEETASEATYAYFATLAMTTALEGKDPAFVKKFLDEIRKTPRKRAHLGTVYQAYNTVGGGNLKKIAQDATRSESDQ